MFINYFEPSKLGLHRTYKVDLHGFEAQNVSVSVLDDLLHQLFNIHVLEPIVECKVLVKAKKDKPK